MMIYLASPYSHDSDVIRYQRYEAVLAYVATHISYQVLYSPIMHFHDLAERYSLPKGFDFWRRLNESILFRCNALHVLMLDGYEESIGVDAEIKFARTNHIPVVYVSI